MEKEEKETPTEISKSDIIFVLLYFNIDYLSYNILGILFFYISTGEIEYRFSIM